MDTLRVIAIHVEEPRRNHFEWVLTEQSEGDWHEIDRASTTLSTYHAAMAAGLHALQRLTPDLDRGPRRADVSRISVQETGDSNASEPDNGAQKRSVFGFGPIR
ncbi:hypothetical protein [uncultured Xylophilus sp.]|uniref:hypothetical protein n=1 Tax=uncultured Xylophilus sp. TaxID=296832 RepID=UPI0025D9A4BA|nr:hypothetical protein [uncultured Xylophilus sp.]